jgi:Domain of unknown function (DUF4145)
MNPVLHGRIIENVVGKGGRDSMAIQWHNQGGISPKGYVCGFCGHRVGPDRGFQSAANTERNLQNFIYVCSYCGKPTYFDSDQKATPGVPFGNSVEHLPQEIEALYNEARKSCSVGAYTSSVLTCRKLLMHIAVTKGADAGRSFISYVEFLSDKGYVPPDGKGWVDHIREKGNEANHEIKIMAAGDAESLIQFLEMLLKFIYEFPKRVPARPDP